MNIFSITFGVTLLITTVAGAADMKVLKPSGDLNIKLGHPSTISMYEVPSQMTHERLNKHGWNVKSIEFIRTDLNSQALAQGTVQMAISQILDPLRAIQKGGKVAFIMENNGGEFVMITPKEIKDCKGIDGKRYSIHGETSTISLASKLWLIDQCKINPKIIIIPGGENRIVALQNNQIDATLVQMADWLNLNAIAPGRFHVIDTGGLFNMAGASWWANTNWLKKNEEVAVAYIAEVLKTHRMIHKNPKSMEAAVLKYIPDTPKKVIPTAVRTYLDFVRAWPQNGGDLVILEDTIKFFTKKGELKPGMKTTNFVNSTILKKALNILGTVSGAR